MSPQSHFQEQDGGNLMMQACRSTITMKEGVVLTFPYNSASNLPLMLEDQQHINGCAHMAGLSLHDVSKLTQSNSACVNVVNKCNQKQLPAEKELKLWHDKLAHSRWSWNKSLVATPHDCKTKNALHNAKMSWLLIC